MSSELVRKRIITTANDFFSRFGFHKTTMNEIAKRIHKAKGALYYYFQSKEVLYTEVLKQELDCIRTELVERISEIESPVIAIETYVNTRMELLNRSKNYKETLLADFSEKYSFVDEVRSDFESFERDQLRILLSKAKADGDIIYSDLESTTDILIFTIQSFEIPLFIKGNYVDHKNIFEELLMVLFTGLKNKLEKVN